VRVVERRWWRGHAVLVVAVHEEIQRHELGELSTKNLGVATQVVNETVRGLLVLSEVANLGEASAV